jgi:hypothetical protein
MGESTTASVTTEPAPTIIDTTGQSLTSTSFIMPATDKLEEDEDTEVNLQN